MNIEFRYARAEDLPRIVALLADDDLGRQREVVSTPVAAEYVAAFEALRADPHNDILVAAAGDRVVGCLQITLIRGLSRRGMRRALLEGIRVDRKVRGQRIGERLLRFAIEQARAAGCGLVQLTSDKRRVDAHRFYERLGFVRSHEGMKLEL